MTMMVIERLKKSNEKDVVNGIELRDRRFRRGGVGGLLLLHPQRDSGERASRIVFFRISISTTTPTLTFQTIPLSWRITFSRHSK